MTVRITNDGAILLEGACPIEDAEGLLSRLSVDPGAVVDWSRCQQAHAAVIQILMAARPELIGVPADPFLRDHVAPWIAAR